MATERQLRNRMRQLQNEIRELRSQNEAFRQEINRQTQERLAAFQTAYENELNRLQNETEAEYSERLRRFQEDFTRHQNAQYQQLRNQAAEVARKQQQKLQELAQCNAEMRQMLQEMKHQAAEADEQQRVYALALLEEAEHCKTQADEAPHEFFFQGQFDIIDGHAGEIAGEIENGMYQAAAADASSVAMEFDLLRIRAEQALQEWEDAFEDYCRIVKALDRRLKALQTQQLCTMQGVFVMNESELDFWSSGRYLLFREKIDKAMETIRKVESMGIVAYLKQEKHEKRKAIFASCTEARQWNDELTGIINCILSERTLSDERWVYAQEALKALEKIGYKKRLSRFRPPDERVLAEAWYPRGRRSNPMDCYDLHLTVQGQDVLMITFIPVRQNGLVVRNECLITFHAVALTDAELIMNMIRNNVERIRGIHIPMNVRGVAPCTPEQMKKEENARKKYPNPTEQIRYISRKYH